MTNSRMNSKVDEYLSKAKKWQEEFEKLRMILLEILNGKGLND